MWYFAWILEIGRACSFGIITALALEQSEANAAAKAANNGNDDAV
ncbi:cytochrome bd-I oxidase subunit CydX [Yersinia wautersii]|nr:cytochrome bd-I oxidase subunit CydX [Yersinia wautersii]